MMNAKNKSDLQLQFHNEAIQSFGYLAGLKAVRDDCSRVEYEITEGDIQDCMELFANNGSALQASCEPLNPLHYFPKFWKGVAEGLLVAMQIAKAAEGDGVTKINQQIKQGCKRTKSACNRMLIASGLPEHVVRVLLCQTMDEITRNTGGVYDE